jgi:putative NADPH-quinone reductase
MGWIVPYMIYQLDQYLWLGHPPVRQQEVAMTKTMILLFHPDLNRSKANATLAAAAADLADVEVVDMQALYPSGQIDVDAEVRRLLSARRIAALEGVAGVVLTRMFYLSYETEGRKLEGTPLMVAATAGNVRAACTPTGMNLFPLEELLRPLQAMANRCGLQWSQPFLVYETNRLSEGACYDAAQHYAERLQQWCSDTRGFFAVNSCGHYRIYARSPNRGPVCELDGPLFSPLVNRVLFVLRGWRPQRL